MGKLLTNHLILLRTFFTYKMEESFTAYTNIFDDLLMKMQVADLKIDEEQNI